MDRRQLGSTQLEVSTLGMGCSRLGAFWQRRTPRDGTAAVHAALDHGVNLFDTADCYARGLSERILGRAVSRARDEIVLCTKVGLVKTPRALVAALRAAPGGLRTGVRAVTRGTAASEGASCFEPAYLRGALERSLRRLRTDWVDVLLLHEPPLHVVRDGAALDELANLVTAGTVRHFGVCTLDEEVALAALDTPGLACIEVPYDLCRTEFASRVIPRARELGVGVLAIAPLGDGHLASGTPGLTAADVLTACLHEPLALPGVSATILGMSGPAHVGGGVDALARTPRGDAVREIRSHHCSGAEPR